MTKTTYSDFASIITATQSQLALETEIHVFPNPSEEYIEVKTITNEPSPFSVLNSLGMEIQTGIIGQPIDVKNWNAGVYYIKIFTPMGKNTTKKFIKK